MKKTKDYDNLIFSLIYVDDEIVHRNIYSLIKQVQLDAINRYTDTIGISVVGQSNWIEKCNKLLND